ncbi:AraC family transcriptional regulator [Dyella mobilis]|uniref:AraC family transcriptional regulator n=1 Tax=Dyella mobilis TaxID=1849582 RepID=A0ABS2KFZ0_9GAMM|nr:AraC family transcriptional regulator [Dyella mobilis]MBM7129687.1 AraC family transcriptional regulator [Dyella mobilis]GLQ98047.1 AraC family transcriptional regulator [Dyella mobilis]
MAYATAQYFGNLHPGAAAEPASPVSTVISESPAPMAGVSRIQKLSKDDVHVEYAVALLQVLEQQGFAREQVLAGAGILPAQLEDQSRLTTHQDAALLMHAVRLTRDPGIGYQMGLHSTLTWHGLMGYGMMSCATLREALEWWTGFLDLRTATFTMQLGERDGHAELRVHDLAPRAPMRICAIDRLLTMTTRLCQQLVQHPLPELQAWYKDREPLHYARYRQRIVATRFGTGLCQIRFPVAYLDLPLANANASTCRHIRTQCERERARLRRSDDLVIRIVDLLQRRDTGYPGIEETAGLLCMSSRTLKRKLHRLGLNFRNLVDDARKDAVLRDVLNPGLRFDEIAVRTGYSDPANLTRAFRRWTGESPSQYRGRLLSSESR